MNYQGGKHRLAGRIAARIAELRAGRAYVEPFLGGASVAAAVGGDGAVLSDLRACVISMWRAATAGWVPPETMTEEEYRRIRSSGDTSSPLYAFAGIGCSWGGRLWGGYARNSRGDNYAAQASASVVRKARSMRGARFDAGPYDRSPPPGDSIVYCDPPYAATTGYGGAFDSGTFWEWVRSAPRTTTVVVSESSGPAWAEREPLTMVARGPTTRPRPECLFIHPRPSE